MAYKTIWHILHLWLYIWQDYILQDIWTLLTFRWCGCLRHLQVYWSGLVLKADMEYVKLCPPRTFINYGQNPHQIHILSRVLDHITDLKQENTDGATGYKMTVASAPSTLLQMEEDDLPAYKIYPSNSSHSLMIDMNLHFLSISSYFIITMHVLYIYIYIYINVCVILFSYFFYLHTLWSICIFLTYT